MIKVAIIKSTKLVKGEKPTEVINLRNKHKGYKRRGTPKSKVSKKFLEFRFNIDYTVNPSVMVKKSEIDDFEKVIYNLVVDSIDTDELRDTIASDPTLATVAEEMKITIEKKETDKTLSDFITPSEEKKVTIDFKIEPEFAWRDVYSGKGSPAWRSTNYVYTGIIYPSRVRNHKVEFDKKQEKL